MFLKEKYAYVTYLKLIIRRMLIHYSTVIFLPKKRGNRQSRSVLGYYNSKYPPATYVNGSISFNHIIYSAFQSIEG